jgi:hypothetical protein
MISKADDPKMAHIGLVRGTYTVLLSGQDTNRRSCLIDMNFGPTCWASGSSRVRNRPK